MVAVLILLCLIDMWQINKRYLNNDMFVEKSIREAPIKMTETDKIILQDNSDFRSYRVLNLASNTFNENETSYYHNSIGGYHAAKLRRYQDLIDAYIAPEMQKLLPEISNVAGDMTKIDGNSIFPILNMLNTKYFIIPLQNGQTVPLKNPYIYGNAWLIDKITYVDNANEELGQLGKCDLRHEAVADKKFKDCLRGTRKQGDVSIAKLTSYSSNVLKYDIESDCGGIVVFSEIYYPGWTATIDGEEAPLGRVNYLLRALNIKPGKHEVQLTFKPNSVNTTETIAYIAYGVLLLSLLFAVYIKRNKQKNI